MWKKDVSYYKKNASFFRRNIIWKWKLPFVAFSKGKLPSAILLLISTLFSINNFSISKIKEKGYKIIDIILITVNSKEKFCESLYNNYNEFKKEILQANGKQCLVIITDLPEGNQPNVLKNEIRAKYAELYPASFGGVAGNIIHCSDSPED